MYKITRLIFLSKGKCYIQMKRSERIKDPKLHIMWQYKLKLK